MYKLELKNEVIVTRRNIDKIFKRNKVFVLGYGSLLYSRGWRKRGMKSITKSEHLIECILNGYKRGPFGVLDVYGELLNFYGVIESKKHNLNVVINQIHSAKDWENLMATEHIAGMFFNYNYRVVDITKAISGVKLPKGAVIHVVANESGNEQLTKSSSPYPHYYKNVWRGVKKERSKTFQEEFLNTGGCKHFH